MKTRLCRLAWLLASLAAFATVPLASAAPAGSPVEAVRVASATAVVRQWRPGLHLFVKGNVGAGDAALNTLASWLAEQGTNWVVVLAENAEGETYTDAEGRTYRGVEAVNHALGKGLMNQTAFGQQVDARTGERNAAFFTLFLKERRLSYYGSDAQDKRGLGEDHWFGNLDRAAVSAMRKRGAGRLMPRKIPSRPSTGGSRTGLRRKRASGNNGLSPSRKRASRRPNEPPRRWKKPGPITLWRRPNRASSRGVFQT